MNYLYPLLVGGVTKLYDDLSDKNIVTYPAIVESFKSVLISLLTIISLDDFYFSFSCMILALFNCGIDNPFWESIAAVSAMLTIKNIPLMGENVILKIGLTIAALIIFLVVSIFEDRLFPEEVSIEKIFFRMLLMVGFAILSFSPVMEFFPFPTFSKVPIKKGILIMLAYSTVSVITMAYLLYFSGLSLSELNPKR